MSRRQSSSGQYEIFGRPGKRRCVKNTEVWLKVREEKNLTHWSNNIQLGLRGPLSRSIYCEQAFASEGKTARVAGFWGMWNACCQSEWYVTNMRLGLWHAMKLHCVRAGLWYATGP